MSHFIVEQDQKLWLGDCSGDPGRTLVKSYARKYKTERGAKIALGKARAYPHRSFNKAKIKKVMK